MSKRFGSKEKVRFDNIAPITDENWHQISSHIRNGSFELLLPVPENGGRARLLPQVDDTLVDEILENLDEEFGRKIAECLAEHGYAELPDDSKPD